MKVDSSETQFDSSQDMHRRTQLTQDSSVVYRGEKLDLFIYDKKKYILWPRHYRDTETYNAKELNVGLMCRHCRGLHSQASRERFTAQALFEGSQGLV